MVKTEMALTRIQVMVPQKTADELEKVAKWSGQSLSSFVGAIIASYWQSPSFASLSRRAKIDRSLSLSELEEAARSMGTDYIESLNTIVEECAKTPGGGNENE